MGVSASEWMVRTLYPPRTVIVISWPSATGIFNSAPHLDESSGIDEFSTSSTAAASGCQTVHAGRTSGSTRGQEYEHRTHRKQCGHAEESVFEPPRRCTSRLSAPAGFGTNCVRP